MAGRKFDATSYVQVQERINKFWTENPNGRIETYLESDPNVFAQVVFKAKIFKEHNSLNPDATGYAAETQGGQGANQTNWHENGETSAIGRALANMGYAVSSAERPSAEEMDKVARGRGRPPKPEAEAAAEEKPTDVRNDEAAAPEAAPRRRGRPPKPDTLPEPKRMNSRDYVSADEPTTEVVDRASGEITHIHSGLRSDRQANLMRGLWKELGYVTSDGHHDKAALDAWLESQHIGTIDTVSKKDAILAINALQASIRERDERKEQQAQEGD